MRSLADQNKLEGIVAKKCDSKYYFDKRSKDWIKIERMTDRELIICGFIRKKPMSALLLGAYNSNGRIVYCGSVSFGVRVDVIRQYDFKTISYSPFTMREDNKVEGETGIVQWFEPSFVCTVNYIPSPNRDNTMRQPVFKGVRLDIDPHDVFI
jgi:ATP-dependent DNA ligase